MRVTIFRSAKDSFVYLGLKEGIVPDQMLTDLEAAQENGNTFDAEKYVEKYLVLNMIMY